MPKIDDWIGGLLNVLGDDKFPIIAAIGLQLLYISLLVIPFWWKFGLVVIPIFATLKYLDPKMKSAVEGQSWMFKTYMFFAYMGVVGFYVSGVTLIVYLFSFS